MSAKMVVTKRKKYENFGYTAEVATRKTTSFIQIKICHQKTQQMELIQKHGHCFSDNLWQKINAEKH